MPKYVQPITDRTTEDIRNRTQKAFWDVVDWQRVNGNTEYAAALVKAFLSIEIVLNPVVEPGMATIPKVAEFNSLIQNIEIVRDAAGFEYNTLFEDLNSAWIEGFGAASPDYEDVNAWEKTLELLAAFLLDGASYTVYSGMATAGEPYYYQTRWMDFQWVEPLLAWKRSPRTGVAISGRGLTMQNSFRRYG